MKRLGNSLAGAALVAAMNAYGASTIHFSMNDAGNPGAPASTQVMYVKDGKLVVKGAGGQPSIDMLFQRDNGLMSIVDHNEKTFMEFDEERISRLADQAQGMITIVQQQLADKLAGLPPEQAARVQEMLGGMGVGQAEPPAAKAAKRLVRSGTSKINGFSCEQIDVIEGDSKVAELCVASAAALGVPPDDYATLEALKAFGERLAAKTAHIAKQFGNSVPEFGGTEIDGIPVAMKDLSGASETSMVLTRIDEGVDDAAMAVPADYARRELPTLDNLMRR